MHTPLNASATPAGALMSSSTFGVPPFQREYAWEDDDEVAEFWTDLHRALGDESYFLGLVILTENEDKKQVIDGQQRILTLTLLAAALHHEAIKFGRKALAERIQADFLRSIDYATDETHPRITLSDAQDNATLQTILNVGTIKLSNSDKTSLSHRMASAFNYLKEQLRHDLKQDPFKRLGAWTDFLTNRVYFAVFIHPDSASAYRIYEVINTRGRELTTADLLKNYVLSQTPKAKQESRYNDWQSIARQFSSIGSNAFVQYIRHVVTVHAGHILPKDLYDYLASRLPGEKTPPPPDALMKLLEQNLPLYLQMVDPSLAGPAEPEALKIFGALNSLGVIAVRPILLAIAGTPDALEGMQYVLQLVVRRIVVGNLGTGNVERRFGEVAKQVADSKNWRAVVDSLKDLNPARDDFITQLSKRSFNKGVLGFIRRSIIANSITPSTNGVLHFIWTRQTLEWKGLSEEDAVYWGSTIGNTFLSTLDRRPKGANDWDGFKKHMLGTAVENEWIGKLGGLNDWNAATVEDIGSELAKVAANVWY